MYVFGPVLSRRLGRSLGIDLIPHKVCTLNCRYCECGATTKYLAEPDVLVPEEDVMEELDEYLTAHQNIDYCTFSGSGEPTLHSGIGRIIEHIKTNYPWCKVAVLTNGTLLHHESVRHALYSADTVIPSLDAVSPQVFEAMLRPVKGLSAAVMVEGLELFAAHYRGELVIEVFILPGYNDTPEELNAIGQVLRRLHPARVDLNSLDRPGTDAAIAKATSEELIAIKNMWHDLPVTVIARAAQGERTSGAGGSCRQALLSTLRRRPSTKDDLMFGLGFDEAVIDKELSKLMNEKLLVCEAGERGDFYRLA